MKKYILLIAIAPALSLQSCIVKVKTVHDGQIGIKRSFGKVKPKALEPGLKLYFLGTRVFKLDGTVQRSRITTQARSRDGVLLTPSIDITFQLNKDMAPATFIKYGGNNRTLNDMYSTFIKPTVESTMAQFIGEKDAEGLYNIRREEIRNEMIARLNNALYNEGVQLNDVMVQTIGLSTSYRRLLSENALFEKKKENLDYQIELKKKENELKAVAAEGSKQRTIIYAEGDSAKYKIVGPELTPMILEKERIDAQKEIGKSGNAQYIIIEKAD